MTKIINEQKINWCWTERLFYTFSDGTIYECAWMYSKNGYNHYVLYPEKLGKPIGRFIVKSKVDKVATVGKTYLVIKPTLLFPRQQPPQYSQPQTPT